MKDASLARTAIFTLETGTRCPIPVQVGSTLIPKTPQDLDAQLKNSRKAACVWLLEAVAQKGLMDP